MSKTTVLIVEDEAIVAADLKNKLEQFGYGVVGTTARGEEAVALARLHCPQIVLMDIRLRGEMDGIEAAEVIRRECNLPVIYLTAHSDAATLERAKRTEPSGYILKPFEERELLTHIEMALYKHRAEQRLRASEERLRTVLETLPAGVWITDAKGKVLETNAMADQIWGEAPQVENIAEYKRYRGWWADTGEPMKPEEWAAAIALTRGETVLGQQVDILRFDGRRATILNSAAPLKDPQGQVIGAVVAAQDITESRHKEQALAASEKRYRTLFTNMSEGFALGEPILDGRGEPVDFRFLDGNDAFEQQSGLRRETVLGRPMTEVLPNLEPQWIENYGRVALTGQPLRFEQYNQGTNRHYEVFCYRPVKGRFAILFRDISERKRTESALLEAKEAAEAGNRAKDRFLVNMSHELRTPLTVIMGMLELALGEALSPEVRSYLESALNSSQTLLSLISDLLDFAHIERGELTLEEVPFDLHACIRKAVDPLFARAGKKEIALNLEIGTAVPRVVLGDCGRLAQVLDNLVENAIRFTERGKVEIAVAPAEGAGEGEVRFAVRDTGIGIPNEALGRLFKKFTQIDDSLTRCYGGSGLGLAISQGLVKSMGGRIAVASAVGEGSLFSFSVPFRTVEEPAGESMPRTPSNPLSILVGEDDPAIGRMLQEVLEHRGWKVDLAEDGRTVLERWEGHGYDLILMDVQMPGMDGLEATRIIRERECGRARTPIVALTAHARPEDEEMCLSAGMDGYLAKPLAMKRLYAAVERLCGRG